ncbi:hypothetical protein AVEN_28899-1 [Araneus ventricosus]|uniref:Uncharacterized protein n=1 Tax=Araneus ventricosus TaxID=182803 RepID=A0A4Y2AKR5_ARAVE|nr:hypothetical protein AVEN_28899-1 [Araneus ventricosus]
MEAAKMEEIIHLESTLIHFSTNLFVLIDKVGGSRMKAHYSYVFGIQKIDGGEYDMTGLKTTYLAKSKLVSLVNDQFAISDFQLKAALPDRLFEVDFRIELVGFQIV